MSFLQELPNALFPSVRLALGYNLLKSAYENAKDDHISATKKIIKVASSTTLGCYLISTSYKELEYRYLTPYYFDSMHNNSFSNETERYKILSQNFGKKFLHFNYDSEDTIKEKCLVLSSIADHNSALNTIHYNWENLQDFYDVKYQIIDSLNQLCETIQKEAKRIGLISRLIISAHGDTKSMLLGHNSQLGVYDFVPKNCFSGLSKDALIYLISCNTGKTFYGISQYLANLSNKTVIAPSIAPSSVSFYYGILSSNITDYSSPYGISYGYVSRLTNTHIHFLGATNIFMPHSYSLFYPTFYLLNNAISLIITAKLLGKSLQIAGFALEKGTSIIAPITKKLNFIDPLLKIFFRRKNNSNQFANICYDGTKTTAEAFKYTGKVIDKSADTVKYYGLKIISNPLQWTGNLWNKGIDKAAQLMPQSQTSIITAAGKITSFISKIPGNLFCLAGSLLEPSVSR